MPRPNPNHRHSINPYQFNRVKPRPAPVPDYPKALNPTRVTAALYGPSSRVTATTSSNVATPTAPRILKRPASRHQGLSNTSALALEAVKAKSEAVLPSSRYGDIAPEKVSAMELAHFCRHCQKKTAAIIKWLDDVLEACPLQSSGAVITTENQTSTGDGNATDPGAGDAAQGVNKFVVLETASGSKSETVSAERQGPNEFAVPGAFTEGGGKSTVSIQAEEKLVKKMDIILEQVKMMGQQEMQRDQILDMMNVVQKMDDVVVKGQERDRALRKLNGAQPDTESPASAGFLHGAEDVVKGDRKVQPIRHEDVTEEKLMDMVDEVLAKAEQMDFDLPDEAVDEIMDLA